MQTYKSLKNINQIINNYDAFIIDIWGVLWDGIEAYKYAKLTLKKSTFGEHYSTFGEHYSTFLAQFVCFMHFLLGAK